MRKLSTTINKQLKKIINTLGTTHNGSYNSHFGEAGTENIEDVAYNYSAITESKAGRVARKASFTYVSENDYEELRRQATLRCLGPKAKKTPCDPACK